VIASLIEVRLMERPEVDSFLNRFPSETRPREAESLARELVRAGRLTEYQAGAILQGKSRGLAIGNYLILDKIGKGGMGMVFKARHRRTKRIIALKVLPPSFARSESAVLRFQREAEAVGRLGHPNIVAALDAGEFNGLHYFAMEYVEGNDLTRLVKERGPLPVDRAIAYLTQAALGLKAAHDRGIFHRDIKPSNLMLDAGGTVKVLDLGLARIEKEADFFGSAEPDLDLTRPGDLMGTVSFMSPEQAVSASDADHRSDIYSLGCTLFYLLTGNPPYPGPTRMACLLAHREQPIPRVRDLRPEVPSIIDTTLQRMLAKAPADRHPSVAALLTDLEACLAPDAHVRAGPVPTPQPRIDGDSQSQPGRLLPTLLWSVAIVLAGGVLAAVVTSIVLDGRQAKPADRDRGFVAIPKPDPPPPGNSPPQWIVPEKVTEERPEEKAPPPIEPIGEVRPFQGHGELRVESVAVTADGKRALSAGEDWKVRCWDIATGREVGPPLVHEGPILSVAVSPDGRRALSGSRDRTVRVWDLTTGLEDARLQGHEKAVNSVVFSPDGRLALSGSGDRTVRLWDIASQREVDRREHNGAVMAVAFSPDGRQALSGSEDKTIRLWDLSAPKGKAIRAFEGLDAVWCVAFAPRGDRALSGGPDGTVTLWDLVAGPRPLLGRFPAQDWVRCVSFLPDGSHVVAGTESGKLILWDLEEKRELQPRLEGRASHLGLAATPDGRHALTADADGLVRYWRLPELTGPAQPVPPAPSP
jgi:serine/threonine protein kinase